MNPADSAARHEPSFPGSTYNSSRPTSDSIEAQSATRRIAAVA